MRTRRDEAGRAEIMITACPNVRPRSMDSGTSMETGNAVTSPRMSEMKQRRAVIRWLGGFLEPSSSLWTRGVSSLLGEMSELRDFSSIVLNNIGYIF